MTWTEETICLVDLELRLVPDIGGRLMDVIYKGESLLFQNPDLLEHQPDLDKLDSLPSRAKQFPFPLWGGEKTWIAPQSDWPEGAPYKALDSGRYSFTRNDIHSVTMISPTCPLSGLQIERVITLQGSDRWMIRHKVTNWSTVAKDVGLWSVAMTRRPASYFFRTLPWQPPKTVFGAPNDAVSFTDGIGQIACDTMREFKLGTHPIIGLAAARILTKAGAIWLINRTDAPGDTKHYAHGHALELYNSGHYDYGELEWHSPIAHLQPAQCHSFDLSYQVISEKPDLTPLEFYQLIESHDEVSR